MNDNEPTTEQRVKVLEAAVQKVRLEAMDVAGRLLVRRQNIWRRPGRRLSECWPRQGLMLGGEFAVLQAPMFDGLPFDPFA